jgi:hypothetical protein
VRRVVDVQLDQLRGLLPQRGVPGGHRGLDVRRERRELHQLRRSGVSGRPVRLELQQLELRGLLQQRRV